MKAAPRRKCTRLYRTQSRCMQSQAHINSDIILVAVVNLVCTVSPSPRCAWRRNWKRILWPKKLVCFFVAWSLRCVLRCALGCAPFVAVSLSIQIWLGKSERADRRGARSYRTSSEGENVQAGCRCLRHIKPLILFSTRRHPAHPLSVLSS